MKNTILKRPERHRRNYIRNTITTSFTFDKRLVESLEKIIAEEHDRNWSRYIEDTVSALLPFKGKVPDNRPYKSYPRKKTLTFTEDFVSKIKAYGNKSLVVETILAKKLRLNLK